jgi:uncharacterized protein
MTTASTPVAERERLHVLDVLRGIALLGMFLVHFNMYGSGGGAADRAYQSIVGLLLEERFWAMFAILFGAGFAIQLRRADARGESLVPRYLRRIAALAVFGFAAHAIFGFNVLLGYAAWGVPLLLFRRWSVRALVVALAVSAASWNIYMIATTAYAVSKRPDQAVRAQLDSARAKASAFRATNERAQQSPSYRAVLTARLQHMRWFYAQPFSFLPVFTLTLFLLGLLGVRLGLFDEPERHRRFITTMAIFGVASSAIAMWVFPLLPPHKTGSLIEVIILNRLQYGFGFISTMWLAFTYTGGILLLVARNPRWLQRLAPFAWTGRMALTNYLIQIAILDVSFSNYGLGVKVTPLAGFGLALALFGADALVSRWWLGHFRFGPFEWVWRCVTYARWEPIRVRQAAADVVSPAHHAPRPA